MKTKTETVEFWKRLEAERHDLSWKQRNDKPLPEAVRIIKVEKKVDHKKRDNIMFHAGRAAQGATDALALRSAKLANRLVRR